MKKQYIYKAYDLIFSSELMIPELPETEGRPDVVIRMGKVPDFLENPKETARRFQASEQEFLLMVDDTASFYIKNGNEIIIEPLGGSSELDIRLFLLGSAFGALLQQRGYLVLHGAALEIKGKGVLFTGRSGMGKSTLAAAFHEKGYHVLTDDVCAVRIGEDGIPYIVPGFPSLKLWKDAAERLGRTVGGLIPVRKTMDKFRIDIEEQFCERTIPLQEIYVLGEADEAGIQLSEITGMDKLEALIRNSYRYRYLEGQGVKPLHFKQCAAAANQIAVYRVSWSKIHSSPDKLASFIERQIEQDATRIDA